MISALMFRRSAKLARLIRAQSGFGFLLVITEFRMCSLERFVLKSAYCFSRAKMFKECRSLDENTFGA